MDRINVSKNSKHLEKPLITFALIAYNQEKYVKEAIDGAFSQTYSPLEIIFSDDCSNDQTFDIMKNEAEKYTGSHKVILNRNRVNQGIAGNINKIMELSRGELIVIAAGDDISLPERVMRMEETWRQSDGKALSIHSSLKLIDAQGSSIGIKHSWCLEMLKNPLLIAKFSPFVFGAGHAWHRSVFEKFPPLNLDVIHEDSAIPFRSAILGKVVYLDEPFVKYRQGVGIMTETSSPKGYKDSLYGKGRIALGRFKIDAIQKRDDALHIGRTDLVVELDKLISKLELSLLFASQEYGVLQIAKFSLKNKINVFVFLKQLIKFRTPIYRMYFFIRFNLAGSRVTLKI